jgi:hypothetical protein
LHSFHPHLVFDIPKNDEICILFGREMDGMSGERRDDKEIPSKNHMLV